MIQGMTYVKNKYFAVLVLLLLLKAVLFFLWIPHTEMGLAPDEAQYWTWSKHLDWGYYSKPPGIAWQIWLGTEIFGDTVLGVRFMSIILSTALSLAAFFLAKSCSLKDDASFWAAVALTFTPIGLISSFLATTDGGMLLFWTLSCACFLSTGNYYLTGLMILCGALFKWPIYLVWIPIILFGSKNKHVIGGLFLSLLGLFPSVVWNYSHDWVTFKHVLTQSTGGSARSELKGNFFEFLGSQIAIFSPILFVLLVLAFIYLIRNYKNVPRQIQFCGILSLSVLVIFLGMSFVTKMQGNWCLFAYPTAFVLIAWYERSWSTAFSRLKWGILVALILIAIVIAFNPFKQTLGWNGISDALIETGYDPKTEFLFGDKYQTTSILSFYGPEQHRAYFLNLQGTRKNQFLFWPRMPQEQKGRTGYFVLFEKVAPEDYVKLLQKYFSKVEYLGAKQLTNSGKTAYIFKCTNYNGEEPPDPNLF